MRRTALVLTATVALLGACGRGQDPTVELPSRSTTSTTSTTASPGPPLEGASTSPVSTPVSARTLLRALRANGQPEADRVVFEFDGGLPGFNVHYVDPPITEDGSGKTITVQGEAYLEVRMESASGSDITGEQVREVYSGPDRVNGDTTNVTEVVRTGDFEGVLTWVIGVRHKAAFRISSLQDPTRLVIEVAR